MILLLLAAVALADPPARPPVPSPAPHECPAVVPVPVGASPPVGCGYDAVPTSQLVDLLATEQWAEQLDADYRVELPACAAERDALKAEVVDLRKLPRPGVARWEGAVLGVAASGLVVFAGVEVVRAAGGVR